MIPWQELDRSPVPGAGHELSLMQRGEDFEIRVGSQLLMSSRAYGSEEVLAERGCARIAARPRARVLVGGLGMGFTLAAALRILRPAARVVVADHSAAVIAWNRGPLAHLAGRPLDDPRVAVAEGDVAESIGREPGAWDAILLDVDNGPGALTRPSNAGLYSAAGLAAAREALTPHGVLGVWSVAPERAFTRRLARAGFEVEESVARGRQRKGAKHTIWLATRPS